DLSMPVRKPQTRVVFSFLQFHAFVQGAQAAQKLVRKRPIDNGHFATLRDVRSGKSSTSEERDTPSLKATIAAIRSVGPLLVGAGFSADFDGGLRTTEDDCWPSQGGRLDSR